MITEHAYDKIFFLEIVTPVGPRFLDKQRRPTSIEKQALTFLDVKDARRYARQRYRGECRVAEIIFPYKLEYEIAKGLDVWQKQRVYRTPEAGLSGFDEYMKQARGTWAGDHTWRLIDTANGKVLREGQPNESYL